MILEPRVVSSTEKVNKKSMKQRTTGGEVLILLQFLSETLTIFLIWISIPTIK